jgi:DNA-directed RNA polymerase specialized sigma24 family protein
MLEPTRLTAPVQAEGVLDFEGFFQSEHERLFQALYLLTGNRYEADDLAQEALMRAYERWGRVGSMDSPVGYVYRTALNLNRSRLRKVRRSCSASNGSSRQAGCGPSSRTGRG